MARIWQKLSASLPPTAATFTRIDSGDRGTRQTLQKMKEIVYKSMKHPQHAAILRTTALKIVVDAGCPPKDYLCEYRAVHEFVRDKIRWTRDPRRFEGLMWPARVLAVGAEDCDGKTSLEASLLLMLGFPGVRFTAIAANPEAPGSFSHVFIEADPFGKGQWIASDPTVSGAKLGWRSPIAFKVMTLEL